MAILGAVWSLLGCGGAASAPAAMLWVEELNVPDANLFALGGNAEAGVYAGARGIYRREGGQWRLLDGTSAHVWRSFSAVGPDLWAVGTEATALRLRGRSLSETAGLRTAGSESAPLEMSVAGVTSTLHDVSANSGQVWASAADDKIWRWDGTGWSTVSPSELTGHYVAGVYSPSSDQLFVHVPRTASGKPTSLARFDGTRWVVDDLGKRWGYVGSLDGSSASDVWAVGMKHSGLFGKTGFAYHWDGVSWTDTPIPLEVPISAISVRGPGDAWASGREGTLLHWNGKAWTVMATGGKLPFTRIFAAPDGEVYVVENDSRLLRWTGSRT